MKNLKQQFIEFKNSTPKHTQWILLGAAFVIVTILLVLLLTHKSDSPIEKSVEDISFNIEPTKVYLTDVEVGSYSSKSVNITVDTPVKIKDIDTGTKDITTTSTCDTLIDFCAVNIIYRPEVVHPETNTTVKINWYVESEPEIVKTANVSLTYSSWKKEEKKVEPDPFIIEEEEPEEIDEIDEVYEPDEIYEPEEIYDEPEPFDEPVSPVDDVKNIAVANPFKQPEPEVLQPEKCSEFAIPGYDTSGRQIGWIKPEHGANYFHPFSDKDCSNPTGKYDLSTGVITSLKDGSKIGTDSDHIGYRNVRTRNLSVPQLGTPGGSSASMSNGSFGDDAVWAATDVNGNEIGFSAEVKKFDRTTKKEWDDKALMGSSDTEKGEAIVSSRPYDRTFILRQFKPIPATIVSEVRADPSVYGCDKSGQNCDPEKNYSIPVRATVDRNVFSDDGRTIILPTGTLLLGYLDGKLPGPYQAFGRMNIKWYQFIRPDGVEFNFKDNQDPYSADAQGRMGVPGHGSTDYVEQMVMPILTALVPAAVNMIAPITDTVINQIDLDNNTIVQSGTIRSSELAKQDIINTWNKITQKLLVDAIDNTVPPFSIAAGTRINVFSPVDLIVTCDKDENAGKKCAFTNYSTADRRKWSDLKKVTFVDASDSSWKGQIRSFNLNQFCDMDPKTNKITIKEGSGWAESGYDYRTVLAYCESQNYQAKNMAKQNAYNANLQAQSQKKQETYGSMTWDQEDGLVYTGDDDQTKAYNTEILGMTYDDDGNLENPWASKPAPIIPVEEEVSCGDGSAPDANGCCTGEVYTDNGPMDPNNPDGPHDFVCCPESDPGGDCFPPIDME